MIVLVAHVVNDRGSVVMVATEPTGAERWCCLLSRGIEVPLSIIVCMTTEAADEEFLAKVERQLGVAGVLDGLAVFDISGGDLPVTYLSEEEWQWWGHQLMNEAERLICVPEADRWTQG